MIPTAHLGCLHLEDHWMRMCASPSARQILHKMQSSLSSSMKKCFGLPMQAHLAATRAAQQTSTLTAIMPCPCQVQVCQPCLRTFRPMIHIQSPRTQGWLTHVSRVTSLTPLVSASNQLDKRAGPSAVACLSSEQPFHPDPRGHD